jgi:hypothetical protein
MAYNNTSNFERSNGATNKMKGNNENIEKYYLKIYKPS